MPIRPLSRHRPPAHTTSGPAHPHIHRLPGIKTTTHCPNRLKTPPPLLRPQGLVQGAGGAYRWSTPTQIQHNTRPRSRSSGLLCPQVSDRAVHFFTNLKKMLPRSQGFYKSPCRKLGNNRFLWRFRRRVRQEFEPILFAFCRVECRLTSWENLKNWGLPASSCRAAIHRVRVLSSIFLSRFLDALESGFFIRRSVDCLHGLLQCLHVPVLRYSACSEFMWTMQLCCS